MKTGKDYPTREQRAVTALRHGMTWARKHLENGDIAKADSALVRSAKTADLWLTGKHPEIHKAKSDA